MCYFKTYRGMQTPHKKMVLGGMPKILNCHRIQNCYLGRDPCIFRLALIMSNICNILSPYSIFIFYIFSKIFNFFIF